MKKRVFRVRAGDSLGEYFFPCLRAVFILSCLAAGLYHELSCALAGALLMLCLFRKAREGTLTFRVNDASVAVGAAWLFYAASCLWAADPGLAAWGIAKYLPVPLFGLCIMQLGGEERAALLADVPWLGGATALLSYLLQFVPALSDTFSVNGRLAGFFQYPNTFACFLLVGLAVLFLGDQGRKKPWDILCGTLLVFGLWQAGSRAVFLLTVPVLFAILLLRREKRCVLGLCAAVAAGSAAAWLLGLSLGAGGAERVAAISTGASTFLGRLLYWKDAIPVILGHPFGLGYLGYYLSQGSFQTGVYSVRWVHNDLLQLLLDVGWIPAALAALAVGKALFSRRTGTVQKAALLTLLAHCMADFDLEFVFLYFVLLLCLDWEDMRRHSIPLRWPLGLAGGCLALFSVYIGIVSALTYGGWNAAAAAAYPWNTFANVSLLAQAASAEELRTLADRILAQDGYIAAAWDAKARAAYAEGDFGAVITCKKKAISCARYSLEEYEDYFALLKSGVALYGEAGDAESAAACLAEISSIQGLLDELAAETDPLAYRIDDVPELVMPEEYRRYLKESGVWESE